MSSLQAMKNSELYDRLMAIRELDDVPREELKWMASHGEYEKYECGAVVFPKGEPVENLYIVLSGYVTIRVDRGAGPRRIMEWRIGEATGMLPYSRMTAPPGDNYVEEPTELIAIHRRHFPRMISSCPVYTAKTVHMMLDRARTFNTSDLQDEKMVSLGKLAAGLAHELNNPASAIRRGASLLVESLAALDESARALGAAQLPEAALAYVVHLRSARLQDPNGSDLSPLQRADREDEITVWLTRGGLDPNLAMPLVEANFTTKMLDELSAQIQDVDQSTVLRWICEGFATHSLASDIEIAAGRIHELVSAVKRFTHVGQLARPESVSVEEGLRDTARVLSSKANAKRASITLDIDPDLPHVCATGGELNQVWMNLLDNALDAISESGTITVKAGLELDRVVVRIADDGHGIENAILGKIFDPFFTTKPPGQGTGLGLDMARRVVRRYHGEIDVQSRPGWTEFVVTLIPHDRPRDNGHG